MLANNDCKSRHARFGMLLNEFSNKIIIFLLALAE